MSNILTIIISYNGIKWIDQCLSSMYESTFQSDILVIDNNSNDDTLSFIKDHYPSVKTIALKSNLGFGNANNIGLKKALETDTITEAFHTDVDILTENRLYCKYLIDGVARYCDGDRVLHYVSIMGKTIPFDIRYIGDGYYDKSWEINILKQRKLNGICYTPNIDDYQYSLLYHVLIHKPNISLDYFLKLLRFKSEIIDLKEQNGIRYEKLNQELLRKLSTFLDAKNYSLEHPVDSSVFYNIKNSYLIMNNNKVYKSFISLSENFSYNRQLKEFFVVHVYRYCGFIIKIGYKNVIKKELKYLNVLCEFKYFPKILRYNVSKNFLIMNEIHGMGFEKFLQLHFKYSPIQKTEIAIQLFNILLLLRTKNILHRDIRPDNIIINKQCEVFLIDFGWATDFGENDDIIPDGLGTSFYRKETGFSDFYSMCKVISIFEGKTYFRFIDNRVVDKLYNSFFGVVMMEFVLIYMHIIVIIKKCRGFFTVIK